MVMSFWKKMKHANGTKFLGGECGKSLSRDFSNTGNLGIKDMIED